MLRLLLTGPLALWLAGPLVVASPTPREAPAKQCVELDIPVQAATSNLRIPMPRVDSNIDTADWVWSVQTWSHQPSEDNPPPAPELIPINGTFRINGQLCVPTEETARSSTLQIATHGIQFDKQYWDSEIKPEMYSYVDAAIAAGYSIFSYDRLGTGKSDKPDAYETVQLPLQVEILRGLTVMARQGSLISSSKVISGDAEAPGLHGYQPDKVVHLGHSYGSVTTNGFLVRHGELSDGAILTGYLPHGTQYGATSLDSLGLEFAAEHDPQRFGDRSSGYVVASTKTSMQQLFFKKGTFTPEMLDYAVSIKQPQAVAEYVTGPIYDDIPAAKFTGPVQYFMPENDWFMCRGDCKNTYDVAEIKEKSWPAASDVQVYIQPGTGHAQTLSLNATAGYEVMFDFFDSFDL